jgi:hypothetical protein
MVEHVPMSTALDQGAMGLVCLVGGLLEGQVSASVHLAAEHLPTST